MQLHEVTEVQDVYDSVEANRLLDQGWKLIAVTSGSLPSDLHHSVACFVLGRKKKTVMEQAIAKARTLKPTE